MMMKIEKTTTPTTKFSPDDGFGPADLRQACAELSLWDHGVLGSRQLGGTRLSLGTGEWGRAPRGPDAKRPGLSMWPRAGLCPFLSLVSTENWGGDGA